MMKIQICLLFLSATLLAVSLAFPAEKSAPLSGAAEIDSVDMKIRETKITTAEEISSDGLQIKKMVGPMSFDDCDMTTVAAGVGGTIGGAVGGGLIGSIICPGIGTAIGVLIGAFIGGSSAAVGAHYTC